MSAPLGPPPSTSSSAAVKKSLASTSHNPASSSNSYSKSILNLNRKKSDAGEITVNKLQLSEAILITNPEEITVASACCKMAANQLDAVLLIGADGFLIGILTDKDIALRVVAAELTTEETKISKVMTRYPHSVTSNWLASEAVPMMVESGRYRHLPITEKDITEKDEIIGVLDMTKYFYDFVSRMENNAAAEVPSTFKTTTLSTFSNNKYRVVMVSRSDPVLVAAKRMQMLHVYCVLVMEGDEIQGTLSSNDILMRVVLPNLSPELTPVEMVMMPKPKFATFDTTIFEALHLMRDGGFFLPIVDRNGKVFACMNVLEMLDAAANSLGAISEPEIPDDYDSNSDMSMPQCVELSKSPYHPLALRRSFSFRFKDHNGHVHRFIFGVRNLAELFSVVMQLAGAKSDDQNRPRLLYEDDEGDKVLMISNDDLMCAVDHATSAGKKILNLYLSYHNCKDSNEVKTRKVSSSEKAGWMISPHNEIGVLAIAGAVVVTSICILLYLKRSNI